MLKYIGNPLALFLLVVLAYFGVRQFGGLEYPEVSNYCVSVYVLAVLMYAASYLSLSTVTIRGNRDISAWRRQERLGLSVFALLCVVAIGLSFGDIYGLREYLAVGVTEARYTRMHEGIASKPLGIAADMTIGIPVVAMAIVMLRREQIRNGWLIYGVAILFVAAIIADVSTGGRNGLFFSLIFVGCTILVRYRKKLCPVPKLPLGVRIVGVLLLGMSVVYSAGIFVAREEMMGRSAADTIQNLTEGFGVSGWLTEINEPSIATQLYSMLVLYITHSFNEFDYLLYQGSGAGPYYGALNFYQPVLLLAKMGVEIPNIEDIRSNLDRAGVYSGLIGNIYLDYGVAGVFLSMFVLGVVARMLWMNLRARNSITNELLMLYVFLQIFTFPFYSVLCSGNGMSLLVAILIYHVLITVGRTIGTTQRA